MSHTDQPHAICYPTIDLPLTIMVIPPVTKVFYQYCYAQGTGNLNSIGWSLQFGVFGSYNLMGGVSI